MLQIFVCKRCRDARWVCEDHPNHPAPHGDCGGAQMPCPDCVPKDELPDVPHTWTSKKIH